MSHAQYYRVSSIRYEAHTDADSSPAMAHQKEIILKADPSSQIVASHDALRTDIAIEKEGKEILINV